MTRALPTVRAGQLKPISRDQAAARTRFDGKTLPKVPRMSRVLPEPFQRSRIEEHHGKSWQTLPADQVQAGDVVPGAGLVAAVRSQVRYVPRAAAECLCPHGEHDGCRGYLILRPAVSAAGGFLHRDERPPCLCPGHERAAGDGLVAAGTQVIVTGESGAELVLKAEQSVQVFRQMATG